MLTPSALKIIHVLLSSGDDDFTVRGLAKEANISPASCSRRVNELEELGYVRKRPKVKLVTEELVYLLSYSRPLRSLESYDFQSLERPEYLLGKIGEIADKRNLSYAYTDLAGAELVAPYLALDEVHLYVRENQIEDWTQRLREEGAHPSGKGSIHLLIDTVDPFYGAREIRGLTVVSNHLLFADMYSCGGRTREAAEFLAEKTGLEV